MKKEYELKEAIRGVQVWFGPKINVPFQPPFRVMSRLQQGGHQVNRPRQSDMDNYHC